MADEKDVTIRITAKNLTAEEFEKARKALAGVGAEAEKAKASSGGFKDALSGVTKAAGLLGIGLGVGAVINFTKGVFAAAGEVHDLALGLGISTEAAQRFKFAAEQGGATIADVGNALNTMNRMLAVGDKATLAALKAAGLSFEELRAMRPEDAFLAIADAVAEIPDPMLQAEVATRLFGKGALSLLPAIKDGFREVADQATVMRDETVKRLEAAGDAWEGLWNRVTIFTGEALGKLAQLHADAGEQSRRADRVRALAWREQIDMQEAWRRVLARTAGEQERFFRTGTFEAKQARDVNLSLAGAYKGVATSLAEKERQEKEAARAAKEHAKEVAESAQALNKYQVGLAKAGDTLRMINLAEAQKEINRELEINRQRLRESGEAWIAYMEAMRKYDEMQRIANQGVDAMAFNLEQRLPPVVQQAIEDDERWRQSLDGLSDAFVRLAQVSGDSFGGILQDLARTISLMQLASQAGRQIREAFTRGADGKIDWASGVAGIASGAAAVWGATDPNQPGGKGAAAGRGALAGMQLGNQIVPVIGGWVGAIAGGIVGAIRGLTEYQKRVRAEAEQVQQLVKDSIAAAGSLEALRLKAHLVEIQIDSAFKSRDPKWIAQVLNEVDEKTRKLTAAMEEYGFTWEDLPVRARQSQMTEIAEELYEKTQLLKGAGIDYSEILRRQEEDYADLIRTAVRTGTEIPSSLKPVIDDLIEMGLLVDENGVLMEELGEVQWAQTMTEGFKGVTDELRNIADILRNGVPGAVRAAVDSIPRQIDIEVRGRRTGEWSDGGGDGRQDEGYTRGTPNLDFLNFGPRTRTALHGEEAVIPRAGVGRFATQVAAALAPMLQAAGAGGGADTLEIVLPIGRQVQRYHIDLDKERRRAGAAVERRSLTDRSF